MSAALSYTPHAHITSGEGAEVFWTHSALAELEAVNEEIRRCLVCVCVLCMCIYMSSCYYMCVLTILYKCSHHTIYVTSCHYTCVLCLNRQHEADTTQLSQLSSRISDQQPLSLSVCVGLCVCVCARARVS